MPECFSLHTLQSAQCGADNVVDFTKYIQVFGLCFKLPKLYCISAPTLKMIMF